MKRKLIVLSGILVLSLFANSAKTLAAVNTCKSLWSQSCTNGAETYCNDGQGFQYECQCMNQRWYCNP